MDFQLLTIAHAAQDRGKFDPSREDAYYAIMGEEPFFVGWILAVLRLISTLVRWCSAHVFRSRQANERRGARTA